jgi:hydrogenase maturation protein HypF
VVARSAIRVRGAVQGVGFRPTVFRLARDHGLAGFVRNDGRGVLVEVEGPAEEVGRFPALLLADPPPLARIDGIDVLPLAIRGEHEFRVDPSGPAPEALAAIPADAATCDACLRELLDPRDRRHRYPFINCTDCGPRFTIVRDLPYDRARTTMAPFHPCAACLAEYEDPASRRFHAEPNACPACGPRLWLERPGAQPEAGEAALAAAVRALAAGEIVAVKGLGGWLLASDARSEDAVARLRVRKRRPHRPFAVMARNLAAAARIAELDREAAAVLASRARPIVLAPARDGGGIAPSVAPGLGDMGVMLPYTPLHHLLLLDGPEVMVMTSGNRVDEPIARTDPEAREALSGIADAFLGHDREIHARADDSVLRVARGGPIPIRRARGYVPDPIPLLDAGPPVLAVGAEQQNTICVVRAGLAHLSQHLGDLWHPAARRSFEEAIAKLSGLLGVRPVAVAHDLHPDYAATRWAVASGLPRVAVQHHHAHIASCLADNGRAGPVLGVAFDGTGCGPTGEAWGGELLLAGLRGYRRLAHLRPIALPGGEAAIREPWRLACAALLDAGLEPRLAPADPSLVDAIEQLVARGGASPPATGAGRWFDAVAALCGLRCSVSYEGQAAAELEAAAAPGSWEPYPTSYAPGAGPDGAGEIDLRPTVREIAAALHRGVAVAEVSARFHETLAAAVAEACVRARCELGIEAVALSGGCFQNRRLLERTAARLEQVGFEVLRHRRVPPNDGGIALGQAAVAARRIAEEERR